MYDSFQVHCQIGVCGPRVFSYNLFSLLYHTISFMLCEGTLLAWCYESVIVSYEYLSAAFPGSCNILKLLFWATI